MIAPEEGIEVADIRTKWPNEAYDFTPWLAKNLDLLGNELGFRLELVKEEEPIGPFSLDILAKDPETDRKVAIENQLEWTDMSHLGQLLTYAAGCSAHVAIWVAPEFRYEHAHALHRLNEWTGNDIRFYGVKLELVKNTPDSRLDAKLRKVVYPGGWNKEITQPPGATLSPERQQFQDFFQPLIHELIQDGFADNAIQYFDHTGRLFPSRLSRDIGYAPSFDRKGAWVNFNIRAEDKEQTKRIFDALQVDREQIELSLTAYPIPEWHWLRHDEYYFSSISIRKEGSIDDPPDKLGETRAWMLTLLPKLKEVFEPRLEKLLK